MSTTTAVKATPDDCVNTLRALMVYTEHARDKNPEPVTYQGKPIEGYMVMFRAGAGLMTVAHGMSFHSIVASMASILVNQRGAMKSEEFRTLTLPLTIVLTQEIAEFMAEAATQRSDT